MFCCIAHYRKTDSHRKGMDSAVVRVVAERLKDDDLKVWFDEWELKPGDSIPAKIEERLEHSRVLLLCVSANAFGSEWARLESKIKSLIKSKRNIGRQRQPIVERVGMRC